MNSSGGSGNSSSSSMEGNVILRRSCSRGMLGGNDLEGGEIENEDGGGGGDGSGTGGGIPEPEEGDGDERMYIISSSTKEKASNLVGSSTDCRTGGRGAANIRLFELIVLPSSP